jgi:hypothetical protein
LQPLRKRGTAKQALWKKAARNFKKDFAVPKKLITFALAFEERRSASDGEGFRPGQSALEKNGKKPPKNLPRKKKRCTFAVR